MGLVRTLLIGDDEDPDDRSPTSGFWYTDSPAEWLARVGVVGGAASPEGALRIGAVYRCVNVLANAIAQLPLKVYRRRYDRSGAEVGKDVAKDHPLYRLLALRPNAWQTSVEWRRQFAGHVLLAGNSYQKRLENARTGALEQLVPLRPGRMAKVDQLDDLRRRYHYTREDGQSEPLLQHEVVHIPAFSTDGLVGIPPVTLMRYTLTRADAEQEFAAREFTGAPKIAGILKSSLGKPPQGEGEEDEEKAFAKAYAGRKGHFSVPILPPHLEWVDVGMSHKDAQFLEQCELTVTDICRWFGVPPHLAMDLKRATFSNIEHQGIDFLTHSVMPWLRLIEDRLTLDLCIDAGEEDLFVEFVVDGLLRADSLARAQTHEIYLRNGVRNPDEVRAIEGLNPRADGQGGRYLEQVNATRPIDAPRRPPAEPPRREPEDPEEDDAPPRRRRGAKEDDGE